MKIWMGSLLAGALLLAGSLAMGQNSPTLKGNNQRTGKNATPAVSNPGQGFITWFRPNATDATTGTIVRNNTAIAPNVTFTGGWLGAPLAANIASFFYDQPPFGDQASDQATGGFITYPGFDGRTPAYYYTTTVAGTNQNDATIGATQSFTWRMDPAQPPVSDISGTPRNYALYVWLPIGPTGTFPAQQFPQRFFVYVIRYGAGLAKTFVDVVDTYAAGPGWVRLGNAGLATNRQFSFDGTNPITITLLNTVPLDPTTGVLTGSPGTSLVYADAALAVPQVGEMQSTPVVGTNVNSGITHTVAAVNQKSVATRNGQDVTISQGVVTSYDYATGNRRWTFRPAEQQFTFTMDDLNANVSSSAGFASVAIGAGTAVGRGTTYRRAVIAAGGTEGVVYDTDVAGPDTLLEDGQYEVQVYIAPSVAGETHGNSVKVFVREGGVDIPVYIDEDRGPGWYSIGGRRFQHTQTNPLRVEITNDSNIGTDVGKYAYADSVRFIGAFDSDVNSTSVIANVNIRQNGGATLPTDVVIVASEDGHIYCLDAQGNADGTTRCYWAYPSIPDSNDAAWVDPNITAGIDGQGGATIAQMPVGFGRSSAIVQRIGGNDYIFIAARNGRVYAIDATGRGDFDFTNGKTGTTTRIWSYPSDFPSSRRAGTLGTFTNASLVYAEEGGTPRLYVPTESGHLIALNPTGNAGTRTTNVLWDFPGATSQIQPITTTPAIEFGRIYFGTAEDNSGGGHFYSLDAATGGAGQQFVPPEGGSFVGGPTTATAAELGGVGQIDTVYIPCSNRKVYAFDATNLGNILWSTDELNTTVTGPMSFTPMNVYDRTGALQVLPTVIVPGDNGNFSALFARAGTGIDATNIFEGKLAWFYVAADGTVGGTSIGGPAGFPGFMYGGDLSGNLYAWSNTPTLPGQGEPPGDDGIPPNNPIAQRFQGAKVAVIDRATYDNLRQDPSPTSYGAAIAAAQAPPFNFEWGQTAYFIAYDFPYAEDVNGNAAVTPSLVNFQISTDGATTRQFAVVARQFTAAPAAPADKDGYAILAFAIQGSGPNSLPPGRGRISWTVQPGRSSASVNSAQVAQDPRQFVDFRVANPLGIKMSASGINDDIGVTTNTADPGALVNGTPDLAGTPGNNESQLTSFFGMTTHAATGTSLVYLYDRSLMTLLRGPDRGVDQVRVARPELDWLGNVVQKQIPTAVFGTVFEDLPTDKPNTSIDYPNIRAENVRATKDPNGSPENPGFSGVFLKPPLTPGGLPIDETNYATRVLQPTLLEIDVDVPRFQPANNSTILITSNGTVQTGYAGRFNVFVDSNGDGVLDSIGGRSEAFRGFWLTGSVAIDQSVTVRTPNVDLGSLPGGAGYTTQAPGLGVGAFTPWGPTVGPGSEYTNMFKSFVVENPGNVNLLDLRVAKATVSGGTRLSWGVFSSSVDDFGWLDAGVGVWSDIDATFARTPQVLLQKSRVGDRGPSILSTNPIIRANPNLDVNTDIRFLAGLASDNPRIAVTLPPGFPVGTYSQTMRIIEDTTRNEALDITGGLPSETYSDPTFTLTFKARETRLTNTSTLLASPMIDDPNVLGTAGATFMHKNLQPSAARTVNGHVVVAWTSTRAGDAALQPTSASTNDQYRIYLAGLDGNNGTPDGRSDPTNAIKDLTGLVPNSALKWFKPSPSSTNGYPAAGYLYPAGAGETVIAGSEKYGAPSLPAKGYLSPFVSGLIFNNIEMAFIGEADKQTPSGRSAESRLFVTRLSVDNVGVPTLDATPYSMPYDPFTQKGRPSIVKLDANRDAVFYSALGAGNSNIFWTIFDYNQRNDPTTGGYTQPQTLDFGDGFESLGAPSISGRQYVGLNGNGQLFDLTFTGKLRGRSNSEVFLTRITTQAGVPTGIMPFPQIDNEYLTPDREAGVFRAQGVEWDPTVTPVLSIVQGATVTPILKGTLLADRQTGLMTSDTTLGGKAYIDPRLGTVRLTTGLPLTTSRLVLTYKPKFKRISVGTSAGHVGVSSFFDDRFEGVQPNPNLPGYITKYWAESNGNGIVAGDNPRVNRLFTSYNRAAAGAGQSARPYMQTMRLGIQLPYQIYTDQAGRLPGSFQVTGVTSFFQVDPVKGRIYVSPQDEDKPITVTFSAVDTSTGGPIGPGGTPGGTFTFTFTATWTPEMDEAPVPIEQAVNESNLYAFPDPFDATSLPRPNLIWMFWTSTRGGSPDLYFQTIAPRFAPQPAGK